MAVDEGLAVSTFPGIGRALKNFRAVKISGKTMVGNELSQNIKVAEVGPLLVLKLNAFGGPNGRRAPKDVHDILYLTMNYLEGTERAIASFQGEKSADNSGMQFALKTLGDDFENANSKGPLSCAAFRLNNQHLDQRLEEESMRIREQCVTVARELLK